VELRGGFGYCAARIKPLNWYDYTILIMLLAGIWSGRRSGFLRKLSLTLSSATILGAALLFSPHLAVWMNQQFATTEGKALLTSFLVISGILYGGFLTIRLFLGKRKLQPLMPVFVDNVGGGLFGLLHLGLVMAWLTIALTLSRSPFIQREVAQDSCLGSSLIRRIYFIDINQKTDDPWLIKALRWQGHHNLDDEPANLK
jgi:uncharacterized membrane protein required for colicin V production